MIKTITLAAAALAALTMTGCASEPVREDTAKEQATYTTGSNIGRRDKSNVQNAQSYKKDPVSDAMGEDYGKGQPIKQ